MRSALFAIDQCRHNLAVAFDRNSQSVAPGGDESIDSEERVIATIQKMRWQYLHR